MTSPADLARFHLRLALASLRDAAPHVAKDRAVRTDIEAAQKCASSALEKLDRREERKVG